MEISPGQCRAARALKLDAGGPRQQSGRGAEDVRDFENERRQSLKIVRTSIQQAFEQAGIEFFDDDGLRLKRK
jgi:hypothetical protein